MRILALNAYHGGSHRQFLDGWVRASRHRWTMLTLPPHHWKWRMRHAAVTFGQQICQLVDAQAQMWDAIFCTDMLNLAELPAFVPPAVRDLPRVIYFHENQLTYPDDHAGERDFHFAFTNFTSALAADSVWFNSAFHRDVFLAALREQLKRMPDEQPVDRVDEIEAKSRVESPGIELPATRQTEIAARVPGPLRLVWAARWEHDKGPELLFDALRLLKAGGTPFQVSVLGESFNAVPPCFAAARRDLHGEISTWGFTDCEKYQQALQQADIFISTARHEFFGIAAVEAAAAGCVPVVPEALAYPEVLGESAVSYEPNSADALVNAIQATGQLIMAGEVTTQLADIRRNAERFAWQTRASAMDMAFADVIERRNG